MKIGTGSYVVTKNGSESECPVRAGNEYFEISVHFKGFGVAVTNIKRTAPGHYMWVGVQHHASVALSPAKSPSTNCTGGWLGPSVSLDGCKEQKIFSP
jgi:hypothetical protein